MHTEIKKKGQNKLFIFNAGIIEKNDRRLLHIEHILITQEGWPVGNWNSCLWFSCLGKDKQSHKPHDPLTLRTMTPSHRKYMLQICAAFPYRMQDLHILATLKSLFLRIKPCKTWSNLSYENCESCLCCF